MDNIELLQKPFFIQIKLSSIYSTFKVQLKEINPGQEYYNFELKILRMYYFFSESSDISEFLSNTELEIVFSRKENT